MPNAIDPVNRLSLSFLFPSVDVAVLSLHVDGGFVRSIALHRNFSAKSP